MRGPAENRQSFIIRAIAVYILAIVVFVALVLALAISVGESLRDKMIFAGAPLALVALFFADRVVKRLRRD